MVDNSKKASFEIIAGPVEVVGTSGNTYIVSKQKITQANGSSTNHLVVNKIKRNVDGTQQGKAKQLFIDVTSAQKVIDALLSFKGK